MPIGVLDETGFLVFQRIGAVKMLRDVSISVLARKYGVNESSLLHTLVVARRLVVHGWCQQVPWCDEAGESRPEAMGTPTRFSLVGALRTAGAGELVGEFAIRHVRSVLGVIDLHQWNDTVVRTQAQVLALLDLAVEAAGGSARRQGGWRVGGAQ